MNVQDYTNYLNPPYELQGAQGAQKTSPLEKIAAAKELTRAADDPALLAISDLFKSNVSGLTQGAQDVTSALSYLNLGDSALTSQSSILDTVKEKLIQASSDTVNQDQRSIIKNEINDLLTQFDKIASTTNYNGDTVLQKSANDSGASDGLGVQVGTSSSDYISLDSIQSNTQGLGLDSLLNDSNLTSQSASSYVDVIDNATTKLNSYRSDIGSTANQLQSSFTTLSSQVVNNSSALSSISNVDYSKEVANFSKQNILSQVGALGQAQANNINQQAVLKLLL